MGTSRRAVLGAGIGLGAAGLLGGCGLDLFSEPQEQAYCVAQGETVGRGAIGDALLVYEPTGREQAFRIDPGFAAQLDSWFKSFAGNSGLDRPNRIRTYGAWIGDEPACDSWHNSGRALDIARLSSGRDDIVSCRYDLWRDAADAEDQRRRYWALAASLHERFSYVVTYLYNDRHANHIHVDNGASGAERPEFDPGSTTQVQGLQAVCRYLYGIEVELTGNWDDQTQRAAAEVLRLVGISGDLSSVLAWQDLMGNAAKRGA